jgi:hypothetical protein
VRSEDFPEFQTLMEGLCAAFDRQCTDAKVKTFYEALKHVHIADLRRSSASWKANFAKMPTPKDLMPQKSAAPPPKPSDDGPSMSTWAIAANKILFSVAYQGHRGFRPMAESLKPCLVAKADYVRMAEEAAAHGAPWDEREFNTMCREGFQKILGAAA